MKNFLLLIFSCLCLQMAAQKVDEFYKKNPKQDYRTSDDKSGQMNQPTKFDKNTWVFLCFGQSNMEGNAKAEAQDMEYVDPRFMMISPIDMPKKHRERGKWYVAYPPLCGQWYGLSPADYFGRTMVERLPKKIKICVINVSIGGCSIDLFDEDKREAYIAKSPDWLKGKCKDYDNDPYSRLIACAREAQQYGVIKGILLHQGCTDNNQQDWPSRVCKVYNRMLSDLNLTAEKTPLLVGELMTKEDGGCCYHHNAIIDKINETIPTAFPISALGCEGQSDRLHFTAKGYRELGRRYAEEMLKHVK